MKVKKVKAKNGLIFYCRPETSDEKTIDEVVNNGVYEKKGVKILKDEKWIDLGGNIGAFSVLVCSKGADVETYEPDPTNYQILCENMKLNGFPTNKVHNKAVVHDDRKNDFLHISQTKQFWRNSLERSFGGDFIQVECVNFRNAIASGNCVKMDIEGSEMKIIEKFDIADIKKMVFEWSFDIDNDLIRYRNACEGLKAYFIDVKYRKFDTHDKFLKNWFPPYVNVFCSNEDNSIVT